MDAAGQLDRLARLGRAVDDSTKDVSAALGAVRQLCEDAGVVYRIAGGIAVIHHGYARFTEDVDVLIEAGGPSKLAGHLDAHGFQRRGEDTLVHEPTGVRVDLLESGRPMPRGAPTYPRLEEVGASERDPAFIGLAWLLVLKLHAARKQDEADVVALLKRLDEASYTAIEADIPAPLRHQLYALREDALEELRWENTSP